LPLPHFRSDIPNRAFAINFSARGTRFSMISFGGGKPWSEEDRQWFSNSAGRSGSWPPERPNAKRGVDHNSA
jgi:hypothetical protein